MKILITNHHLMDYAGSEIYTLNLAKGLQKFGHEVVVYSKFIDKLADDFDRYHIIHTTNLDTVKDFQFDIAHVHHNIYAYEVRYHFPNLPIFYLSHGTVPFLEKPPVLDVNIQQYGVVCENFKKMLISHHIPETNITVLRNIIDENTFFPVSTISSQPRKALLLSSKIDEATKTEIINACKAMNIELFMAGQHFQWLPNEQLPELINRVDIVFTIGRGVVETMMCRRIPFVIDIHGSDGILTPQIFSNSQYYNFSGTFLKKKFSAAMIVEEIKKIYSVTLSYQLHALAQNQYATIGNIPVLLDKYEETIRSFEPQDVDQNQLSHLIGIVNQTAAYQSVSTSKDRNYTDLINHTQNLSKMLYSIQSSKTYRLWQWYNNTVKKILNQPTKALETLITTLPVSLKLEKLTINKND